MAESTKPVAPANSVTVALQVPTVFADWNAKNGLAADYVASELYVKRLKFGHFKQIQTVPEMEQMHKAISMLTGLSNNDIDELDAEDAAEITTVVFGFMEKYMQLARKMGNLGQA